MCTPRSEAKIYTAFWWENMETDHVLDLGRDEMIPRDAALKSGTMDLTQNI
jgi:hypothetical protein